MNLAISALHSGSCQRKIHAHTRVIFVKKGCTYVIRDLLTSVLKLPLFQNEIVILKPFEQWMINILHRCCK